MGHSYKGRRNPFNATPLVVPAPVLTDTGGGFFDFTFSGTDPDNWGFFVVPNADPASPDDVISGTDREFFEPGLSGQSVYVRGINAGFTAFTTPPSNVVVAS
jgi:hypothetical protein